MPRDIDRREFLKCTTAAGVLGALPIAEAVAAPTTTPVAEAPVLVDRQLDSLDFCRAEYASIAPSLSFSATYLAAARRWQRRAR